MHSKKLNGIVRDLLVNSHKPRLPAATLVRLNVCPRMIPSDHTRRIITRRGNLFSVIPTGRNPRGEAATGRRDGEGTKETEDKESICTFSNTNGHRRYRLL
jgi:hypothetical protein